MFGFIAERPESVDGRCEVASRSTRDQLADPADKEEVCLGRWCTTRILCTKDLAGVLEIWCIIAAKESVPERCYRGHDAERTCHSIEAIIAVSKENGSSSLMGRPMAKRPVVCTASVKIRRTVSPRYRPPTTCSKG